MSSPEPFTVHVPQEALDRICGRVRAADWPDRLGDGGWSCGVSYDYLRGFADYWVNAFDWRQAEADLNRYPQFRARVGGHELHFYHVRGRGPDPFPLLLTHGWPDSVAQFLGVIGPLADPERHGGSAADAFDLVIPSIPGFGFSSKPPGRALGSRGVARLWHELMTGVLGYRRFGAQGGDWGGPITAYLAHDFPAAVAGIHLNLVPFRPVPEGEMTAEEREWLGRAGEYMRQEFDYFWLQAHKTTLPAFALADSPLGAAAWILEKFKAWSDSGDDLGATFTKDQLLTNIVIYLTTRTVDTSLWIYRGFIEETEGKLHPGNRIDTPTGVAVFPREMLCGLPPRSWVARDYHLTHWTEMPRGGHFASLEQPELFVRDVREFFRSVRR